MTDANDTPTRKVVETEHGFQTRVSHKRGTGTRDEDKVTLSAKTEDYPDDSLLRALTESVTSTMNRLRENQPDADEEDDD